MPILAELVAGVIGVDTHRDTLAAAALSPVGGLLAQTATSADAAGYQSLLAFGRSSIPGARCWAIEGAGSYGAGLATYLAGQGEQVTEVGRPKRPPRRTAAKTDPIDAIRAARDALGQAHTDLAVPRQRGDREALRVLLTTRHTATVSRVAAISQLKALIVAADEQVRATLRRLTTDRQVAVCADLAQAPTMPVEQRMTIRALRSTARRIQHLQAEAHELEADLHRLVRARAPWLLELPGVGVLSAAQILVSWSHAGRLRSEAAFAALAGVNPIPASSGHVDRHRLNRGGDRQLNRALHTIALVRLRDDPDTRAYAARRRAQGKSTRDIQRCLKRTIARQLFKLLERYNQPDTEILSIA
jgi:transposase